jgi:hypothetical protein
MPSFCAFCVFFLEAPWKIKYFENPVCVKFFNNLGVWMSVHVVHDLENLPIFSSNVSKAKRAIIDASDAGELGYKFGYEPEDLCKLVPNFKSIMMIDGSRGLFDSWTEMIVPYNESLLLIFGAPHFHDPSDPYEQSLGGYMCHEKSSGHSNVRKRPAALVKWLRKQGYEQIWFLVTRVPTTLHESIKSAAN